MPLGRLGRMCSARGCCNRYDPEAERPRFHCFPTNLTRAEQWAKSIGRHDFVGRQSYKGLIVCSEHFADSDYNRPKVRHTDSSLVHNALPKIQETSAPDDTSRCVSCKATSSSAYVKIKASFNVEDIECRFTRAYVAQTTFPLAKRSHVLVETVKQEPAGTKTCRPAVSANIKIEASLHVEDDECQLTRACDVQTLPLAKRPHLLLETIKQEPEDAAFPTGDEGTNSERLEVKKEPNCDSS